MSYTGGFGVELKIGSAPKNSSPTFTTVAQVQKVGEFESELVMVEVTGNDANNGDEVYTPTGKKKKKVLELQIGLDMNQVTHAHNPGGLLHAHNNETLLAYQLVYPDDLKSTWTFDAYVQKFGMGAEQEKEWQGKISLRITGTANFSITPPAP